MTIFMLAGRSDVAQILHTSGSYIIDSKEYIRYQRISSGWYTLNVADESTVIKNKEEPVMLFSS